MTDMTVKDLAGDVGLPVDALLGKLADAGIKAESADSPISSDDKMQLLAHIKGARKSVGLKTGDKKVSVPSRQRSQLKVSGQRGTPSRTVNVEVRKKRTFVRRDAAAEAAKAEEEAAAAKKAAEEAAAKEAEAAAAKEAEAEAAAQAEEAERKAAEEAKAEEAAKEQAEAEQAKAAEAEEQARQEAADAEKADAAKKAEEDAKAKAKPDVAARREIDATRARAAENLRRAAKAGPPPPQNQTKNKREAQQRKREELHVAKGKSGRRRRPARAAARVRVDTAHGFEKPTAPVIREVEIPEAITVEQLANRMAVKANDLIKQLFAMGEMVTINQTLDQDMATLIVEEMGHKPRLVSEASKEEALIADVVADVTAEQVEGRAPVVTIMGHVDHGKTSLLDYIRKSRVAAGEAGGITQHIGAYHVETKGGNITFLDTPGHAAFTKMRARGAQTTDVVILVCAADDGVMPQTKEAIQHAKAAEVPMVVALTKCDREEADPERVKNELSAEEVIPEDWGGDYQFVNVSSHTGEGIPELLEAINLQAELLELKAASDVPAKGVVIESSLEKGRGSVATVLVQEGTLSRGDVILAGAHFGRVRALFDERGDQVKSAGPSIPVEVLGLGGTPEAGDEVVAVANEKKAKELAEMRIDKQREKRQMDQAKWRREAMMAELTESDAKQMSVFIKADVQGSVEALADAILNIPTEELRVKIIAAAVGGISESDIDLAAASNAFTIGFNVRADGQARKRAQETGVDIRYYSVIYDVINDIKDAVSGLLGTETQERIVGTAEVREVFSASKWGDVAGCLVVEGQVRRGLPIRVLRDNVVIYEGELESLRRHKDDVDKVDAGTECGIAVKNYNNVRKGDSIEVFERVEVQRQVADEAAEAEA